MATQSLWLASSQRTVRELDGSILRLAAVRLPDQRQKVLQTLQRIAGNDGCLAEAQPGAVRAIEHPRRNPKNNRVDHFRKDDSETPSRRCASARYVRRLLAQTAGAIGTPHADDKFSGQCEHGFEVDGGVHRGSRAADRRRDEKLSRLGYRLVRVDAALVLAHQEQALAIISCALR